MSDGLTTMAASEQEKGLDWQLLRRIDAGDPDYSIEHLTQRGIEHLNALASAGYVEIERQTVTVTTSGLAALMKNYSFVYACELIALRERGAQIAEIPPLPNEDA